MKLRTFKDNLCEFYNGDDLEKCLAEGLCRYMGKDGQSVRRKVYNWMQNRNLPSDREELFCICFLLGLDETASDFLLKRLDGQGIHYRNIKELVYAYCLKNNMGYEYARELAEVILQPEGRLCSETASAVNEGDGQAGFWTSDVKEQFQILRSHEELFQFIIDRKGGLGKWHNTAYHYFDMMLKLLTEENGKMVCSLEGVTDTYLRLGMPVDKCTSSYNYIQKLVKKHWPGSRNIKAMKARTSEVTRKTLLLLYIATGGMYHCRNMNRMLSDCGMGRIDPRNAFDFLVLYSIRPEKDLFMSERIKEIIDELYNDVL